MKWHPGLTEEQILDAKARGIYEPVGPEYEQFLLSVGIDKDSAVRDAMRNAVENVIGTYIDSLQLAAAFYIENLSPLVRDVVCSCLIILPADIEVLLHIFIRHSQACPSVPLSVRT